MTTTESKPSRDYGTIYKFIKSKQPICTLEEVHEYMEHALGIKCYSTRVRRISTLKAMKKIRQDHYSKFIEII